MFIVQEGKLNCLRKNGEEEEKNIRVYNPGDYFGEISLLLNEKRFASIQCETDCELFSLDKATFDLILKEDLIKKRENYWETLNKVKFFENFEDYDKALFIDCLKLVVFEKDEFIIKQVYFHFSNIRKFFFNIFIYL